MKKFAYFLKVTPEGNQLPIVEKIVYARDDEEAEERAKPHIPPNFTGEVYFVRLLRDLRVGFDVFPCVVEV